MIIHLAEKLDIVSQVGSRPSPMKLHHLEKYAQSEFLFKTIFN